MMSTAESTKRMMMPTAVSIHELVKKDTWVMAGLLQINSSNQDLIEVISLLNRIFLVSYLSLLGLSHVSNIYMSVLRGETPL